MFTECTPKNRPVDVLKRTVVCEPKCVLVLLHDRSEYFVPAFSYILQTKKANVCPAVKTLKKKKAIRGISFP